MTSSCPIFAPIKRVPIPGLVLHLEKRPKMGLQCQISTTDLETICRQNSEARMNFKEIKINMDGGKVKTLDIRMNELQLTNLSAAIIDNQTESKEWKNLPFQSVHFQQFQLKRPMSNSFSSGVNLNIPPTSIESENETSWQLLRNFGKHIFNLACQNLNESQKLQLQVSDLKRKVVLIHEILHIQEVHFIIHE